MPKFRLKNTSRFAPRVVYNADRQPIMLEPGEERIVNMNESTITIMRQRDSDVVAKLADTKDAPEPDKPADKGKVAAPKRKETASEKNGIIIPKDWEDLEWPKLRQLATKVSDSPIRRRSDAVEAINAELAKRAA